MIYILWKKLVICVVILTIDFFNEIILMPRMYPIKTKVLPDYEIDWNFDNSKLKLNVLKKNEINLFDIEKFLKK